MTEVEESLILTASNFKVAEENLKDAGDELHTVVEKMEECLKLIAELRQYEPFLDDAPWFDSRELQLVGV